MNAPHPIAPRPDVSPAAAARLAPPLVDRLLAPFRRFAHTASAGGVMLLAVTAVALAWANSPWAESYHHLWETTLTLGAGAWSASMSLHHFINDGLMVVFFFLVGLEIKREMLAGELASIRRAALPMVGALGGMVIPAAIYALINQGGPGAAGWGVPMATDIAFALGVLALLGDRVPIGLKVFLAALAIVDDIGAVLVIAIFYSGGVSWGALGASAALVLLSAGANAAGVRRPWAYGFIGIALWGAVLVSGVHATVAGVLLAMTIPVRTRIAEGTFLIEARRALDEFDRAAYVSGSDPRLTVLGNTGHHTALEELETLTEAAQPPLIRMEHSLHGLVQFGIMPLFALANAGVALSGEALGAALSSSVTIGALLGLLLGKPIGIVAFSWAAVRVGWAALPDGVTWRTLTGAGVLGGIGFTMALFIAALAFPTAPGTTGALLDAAKVGVLAASTVAGIVGYLLLVRPAGAGAAPEATAGATAATVTDRATE